LKFKDSKERLQQLSLTSSVSPFLLTFQIILKRQQANPHLYKTGPTKYQDGSTKGHWTKEEDIMLTESVKQFGGKNWKKIAGSLPGRTDV